MRPWIFWSGFLAIVVAIIVGGSLFGAPGRGPALPPDDAAGIIPLLILLALYFLPTLRAYNRRATNLNAVFAYNLLIGWTVVGWIVAYGWVPEWPRPAPSPLELDGVSERHPCPHCAEAILPAARVCRYCGHALKPGWADGAEVITLSPRHTVGER
jgi:hypothetical protein